MTRLSFKSKFIPCASMMLLCGAALFSTGCGADMVVKRTWSSQKAWERVERGGASIGGILGNNESQQRAIEAQKAFEREAESQANSSLPPGALESLLSDINEPFAKTVANATSGLNDGASGIIVLGDFTGPDNRPLATDVDGKVDKQKFLNRLQLAEGVQGQWFVMAMTIEEIRQVLKNANAVPGQAVKLGQYEFIYNPANIYQMRLAVSSKPFEPQHQMVFTGIAELVHVQSGTTVQGTGDAKAIYYYQPYAKEWLVSDEELRRREAEKLSESENDATPDAKGKYPRNHDPNEESSGIFG